MKISFHSYANVTGYHIKSIALSHAFVMRFEATRKWTIFLAQNVFSLKLRNACAMSNRVHHGLIVTPPKYDHGVLNDSSSVPNRQFILRNHAEYRLILSRRGRRLVTVQKIERYFKCLASSSFFFLLF